MLADSGKTSYAGKSLADIEVQGETGNLWLFTKEVIISLGIFYVVQNSTGVTRREEYEQY